MEKNNTELLEKLVHINRITKVVKDPMSKIEFSYKIINNKVEICNGVTKLAFYDPETKRPKKCPLEIKEKFFNS